MCNVIVAVQIFHDHATTNAKFCTMVASTNITNKLIFSTSEKILCDFFLVSGY